MKQATCHCKINPATKVTTNKQKNSYSHNLHHHCSPCACHSQASNSFPQLSTEYNFDQRLCIMTSLTNKICVDTMVLSIFLDAFHIRPVTFNYCLCHYSYRTIYAELHPIPSSLFFLQYFLDIIASSTCQYCQISFHAIMFTKEQH